MRVLLRAEQAGPHRCSALVLALFSSALTRRSIRAVEGESPCKRDLSLCQLVTPLPQFRGLLQGIGLSPFAVPMAERHAPVPALPCCERRVERPRIEQSSWFTLVHRYGRSLLSCCKAPALRFLRHRFLPCQPPFRVHEPAALVASPDRVAPWRGDEARRGTACGRPAYSGAVPRRTRPFAQPG